MIRPLLPIQLLCRDNLQHTLLRIRHIIEVEHNTVRNVHLPAKEVQLARNLELRALIDRNRPRTECTLTEEGLRIIFGHNTERGECELVHVQHSILPDMDAVRVDKRDLSAARLTHRAEDVGHLRARDLIEEQFACRHIEIQRLTICDAECLPVDLTVVRRRDGCVIRNTVPCASAEGNGRIAAHDFTARRHSECRARERECNECRKAAAAHFLLEIHSVPSFPFLSLEVHACHQVPMAAVLLVEVHLVRVAQNPRVVERE